MLTTYCWFKIRLFVLVSSFGFLFANAQPASYIHYQSTKQIHSRNGAVVSAHPLSTQAGIQMLRQGGNAFDAAVATQLALAVVYPAAGNLGGGGFIVARRANGENITIDFREKAPGLAGKDMYLDEKGNVIPGKSLNGHPSAGVPGSVAGIFSYYVYAKLPFKKLIQPSIDLAAKGFAITSAEAADLNANQSDFKKYNTVKPVFVKEGGWKAGDILVQKDLAATLRRIRDHGMQGFYEGETARLIVEEMKRGTGLISYTDLKNYTAKKREPVIFDYKNKYRIITMPLPSSGGILLPQMMGMAEEKSIGQYGFETLPAVHLMAEIERLAYADRATWLGDVDFYKVPVGTLTSKAYLKERMKNFNPDSAGNSQFIQAGTIRKESEETTHFNTYDREGNCVSITTTLNDSYGSRTVVGGAGFLLNNEMDDFSVKPGEPNLYGAVGGEANAIAPGKRMLSSMTPTIVLLNDKPFLVLGTPGGTTITTSVFQTLMDILEFNLSTADAVNKPKFHHQWLPDILYVEEDFPPTIIVQLQQMGYRVEKRESIGRTEVIRISATGDIEAVADKRGDDDAGGF